MKTRVTKVITICVCVLLNTGLAFTQKKVLPPGFPVDCPTVDTVSEKEANSSFARITSDLLVDKAKALLSQPSKETILGAIDSLEKAVRIDSTNAETFYQLSSAYGLAPRYASMLKKAGAERSMFYFLKAFSLNPNSVNGLRGMANRMIEFKNDYVCAERLLLQILKSDPKNARILFEYAVLVAAQNRFNEAYRVRETALAFADSLTKLLIHNNSSRMHYMAHDYDLVIENSESMIAFYYPETRRIHHFYKALALSEQGKFEEGLAESKIATPSLEGDAGGVANLARAYILAGDIENGTLALQELLNRFTTGEHVVKYQIAAVYEALGDFDNTFLWLNKVVDDGDGIHGWLIWLNHDPRWKRIRNDIRFHELTLRAGL